MTYRYSTLVDRNLRVAIKTGPEWMTECPFHGGRDSLQVNVEKGLFICFGCDARGTIKKLAARVGARFMEDGNDVADIRARLDLLQRGVDEDADLSPIPESTIRRYAFPTDYWTGERGYLPRVVMAFDLGYDPMYDTATIALRNTGGDLVGFIKRSLDPDAQVRYRYPKGFKRARNLFAAWMLAEERSSTVCVCEGATDAIAVWQAGFPAVAVYGSSMSPTQMRLLLRLGVTNLVLFYDNPHRDKAGLKAFERTCGRVTHLRGDEMVTEYRPHLDARRMFVVRSAAYERRLPKDPGAMTKDQIVNAVANATEAA